MRSAFDRAATVVAVSHETKRLPVERAGLDAAKTVVVWEGADSVFFPEPVEAPKREERLLVVSALGPHKNLERGIDLFAELQRSRPRLVLDIAGADWRGHQELLETRIRARRLDGAVHLLGAVRPDRLARVYER